MQKDVFSTDNFYLSYHGIDVLKKSRVIEHIDFRNIYFVEIKKGRWTKKWIISTVIGIIISILSLLFIVNNVPSLNLSNTRSQAPALTFYFSFIILFVLSLIMVIHLNTKSIIIKITLRNKKTFVFLLSQIIKENRLDLFINFLDERVEVKNLKAA